ncbi:MULTISPECIES: ATP-binding protein [Acidiphilium]|uniref:ATP-binding protein n=1 Tax=Acidiphilium acidophilum TaxID=76588 RepID=A0AAW9DK07_ACIAO|nr:MULTISPECIES: ATP-binding protein [Acidiphilium]MDX5929276.1 ATP-binding protein [Acidiphilium acidophilum]
MTEGNKSFKVGIDFESVLRAISKQIYETPLAFIRENVQNAVDAIRIQALRDGVDPGDEGYKIEITVVDGMVTVRDNGIGMSEDDLQSFFWTIGASGKRTQEAQAAGCVGMFGIGGFANFGVCDILEVISQTAGAADGTLTRLSEADIQKAGAAIPSVTVEQSDVAAPRGTVVVGHMRKPPNVDELKRYLLDFVRFVPTKIYFGGQRIPQGKFADLENRENLTEIRQGTQQWQSGDMVITGRLYADRGHAIIAAIDGLTIGDESISLVGFIRFENGPIDVFKRGFKLCATQIGTTIGVSGRLDCDRFIPTAGRDSLDAPTTSLLGRIVHALEKIAIEAVLESPERIGQHTRIFRYVLQHGLVNQLGKVKVTLADGSESTLAEIRRRAEQGGVGVFFGLAQKQALNQIMQARGHIVVLLSSDRQRQDAERRYLEQFCNAKPFDGMIDCTERYAELSRFERVFLSELELNISKSYEVQNFRLIAGKLTEDIPVFVKEHGSAQPIEIFVDVRHPEIVKLQDLGYSALLYSLIGTFCREYLGPSLKKWSPRFFGDGALNLELLAKRRSELWILLKDDIGIVRKGGQKQVVTRSDVQVVTVGGGQHHQPEPQPGKPLPRIIHVIDEQGSTGLGGYYLRLPDPAYNAYGDLLPECESRGVVWAGNKIMYVASDTVSAAFQYEIRVDEVVAADVNGSIRAEGAIQLDRPLQEMYGGMYFPIPGSLERFLVPQGNSELRLELHCDWIDMRTAKHWQAREAATC